MAFNAAERERLYRSAVAMILQSDRQRGEYSLTQQLKRAYPPEILDRPQPHNAYQAIARQALIGVERGREAQALGDRALPLARLPTDPGIRADDPRYRYRVLVTATGAAGRSVSFAIDINSDTRMSQSELEEFARENFDGEGSSGRSDAQAIAALGPQAAITATVLTAGQRAR